MTSLKVAQRGEAILSIVAVPVTVEELHTQWIKQLSLSMFDTMLDRQGVGIAAPQVYVSKRMIIVASRPNLRYPDAPNMEPIVMVNPEILAFSSHKILGEEGCLSVPNDRGDVLRAESIKVRYLNLQGEEINQELHGFPARIVQHEVDHLDGILFIDRLK